MSDVLTAFWTKVIKHPDGGCWEWTAGRTSHARHGLFFHDGPYHRAHRFAYQLVNGPIPEGMVVRHLCHNPICVRPDHLALGTQTENVRDTVDAGRQARGERSWAARLTEADVRILRVRHAAGGVTYAELAAEFGVGESTVGMAVTGKTWGHVK